MFRKIAKVVLGTSMLALLSTSVPFFPTTDAQARTSLEVKAMNELDLSKVILVKENSKIEVDFFTYIDALGSTTALNGYQIQYLVSGANKIFDFMDYVDYYASGNTPIDVIGKLQAANKSTTVSNVLPGGFVDGKLTAIEEESGDFEVEDIE